MLSEQQLNALNRHIEEIQSQLEAIAPIIRLLQDKAKVLSDILSSIKNAPIDELQSQLNFIGLIIGSLQDKAKILGDVVRSIQSEPTEESQLKSSVSFVSNGNAPKS